MKDYAETKNETRKHILEVDKLLKECAIDLLYRGINHDISKLGEKELPYFDIYIPKLAKCTYGSEEYKTFLSELRPALIHHYESNDHHPEHFENGIQDMNLIQIIEMLCDWRAASMRHNDGDIRKSIELNQSRFNYSDEFKKILLNTVNAMCW